MIGLRLRRNWDPGQLAPQAQPTRDSDSKKSTGPGQTACHSVKVIDDVVYKKILIDLIIINQPMFLVLLKMIVIIKIQK